MRVLELFENNNISYLQEFWNSLSPKELRAVYKRGNCQYASIDFAAFMKQKYGISVNIVKEGGFKGDKKVGGWFKADVPDLSTRGFTDEEEIDMVQQGYDFYNEKDREEYAIKNNLIDDLCFVPHSYVVYKNKIYDPSGFAPDGKSGQFDHLVKDKSDVTARYKKF